MTMSSSHTKVEMPDYRSHARAQLTPSASQKALEALHPNIACMRHPDHIGSKGVWVLFSLTGFVYRSGR